MTIPRAEIQDEIAETERLGIQLAATQVLAMDGTPKRLRDFFRRGTTVTTFVRHFGCLFCHQMVSDLVLAVPDILRTGAHIGHERRPRRARVSFDGARGARCPLHASHACDAAATRTVSTSSRESSSRRRRYITGSSAR